MAARTAPVSTLGIALERARVHLALQRQQLQEAIGASNKTLRRWEEEFGEPSGPARGRILAWARTLDPAIGHPILEALGATIGRLDAAPVATADPAPIAPAPDVARAVDDAFHALAESLDVGPRTLRGSLGVFLDALAAARVDVVAARARLAAGEETARMPTKERRG